MNSLLTMNVTQANVDLIWDDTWDSENKTTCVYLETISCRYKIMRERSNKNIIFAKFERLGW